MDQYFCNMENEYGDGKCKDWKKQKDSCCRVEPASKSPNEDCLKKVVKDGIKKMAGAFDRKGTTLYFDYSRKYMSEIVDWVYKALDPVMFEEGVIFRDRRFAIELKEMLDKFMHIEKMEEKEKMMEMREKELAKAKRSNERDSLLIDPRFGGRIEKKG